MFSLTKCREILGAQYEISDDEMKEVLRYMYSLANHAIDLALAQPYENTLESDSR